MYKLIHTIFIHALSPFVHYQIITELYVTSDNNLHKIYKPIIDNGTTADILHKFNIAQQENLVIWRSAFTIAKL